MNDQNLAKTRDLEKRSRALNRRAQKRATLPTYQLFKHPKEFYEIDYPKDWQLGAWSENEDAVAFYTSDEVAVYIHVLQGVV